MTFFLFNLLRETLLYSFDTKEYTFQKDLSLNICSLARRSPAVNVFPIATHSYLYLDLKNKYILF